MAAVRTLPLAFGLMVKTNRRWNQNCQILHAVGDKHTYTRNTKQCLYVRITNTETKRNFDVMSGKFNVHRICTQVPSYSQKIK